MSVPKEDIVCPGAVAVEFLTWVLRTQLELLPHNSCMTIISPGTSSPACDNCLLTYYMTRPGITMGSQQKSKL